LDLIDEADTAHFRGLCGYLDALGVDYVVDPSLVRGLDYYTRTLFEVRAIETDLGAQNTLAGGGRYDNMIEGLGGPKVPAIGFAAGMERILIAMSKLGDERPKLAYLLPLSPAGAEKALLVARDLRREGVVTELDGRGGKLKTMLSRAERRGAAVCVILGDEVSRGVVSVKDMSARTQEELPLDTAARTIADRLRALSGEPTSTSEARGAR